MCFPGWPPFWGNKTKDFQAASQPLSKPIPLQFSARETALQHQIITQYWRLLYCSQFSNDCTIYCITGITDKSGIQALSTTSYTKFENFQAPNPFSGTWKWKNISRTYKDFQKEWPPWIPNYQNLVSIPRLFGAPATLHWGARHSNNNMQDNQLTRDASIDPPIQLLNLLSALTVDEISFNFMLCQQTKHHKEQMKSHYNDFPQLHDGSVEYGGKLDKTTSSRGGLATLHAVGFTLFTGPFLPLLISLPSLHSPSPSLLLEVGPLHTARECGGAL